MLERRQISHLVVRGEHDELQLFRSGGHTVIEVRQQLCAQPTLTTSARSHKRTTVLAPLSSQRRRINARQRGQRGVPGI